MTVIIGPIVLCKNKVCNFVEIPLEARTIKPNFKTMRLSL